MMRKVKDLFVMEDNLPNFKSLFTYVVCMGLFTGCSYLKSWREPLEESGDTPAAKEKPSQAGVPSTVSKKQYDELLAKYSELQAKYVYLEKTKAGPRSSNSKSDMMAELVETVDVFSDSKESKELVDYASKDTSSEPVSQIQKDVTDLQMAIEKFGSNDFDTAINLLKRLENSKIGQVSVRAKLYIGKMLMKQKEFDLALQVFEEIIMTQAFSGVVIESLESLVLCSRELGLEKKFRQYKSLLTDVFKHG
jgi:hypothetical protein